MSINGTIAAENLITLENSEQLNEVLDTNTENKPKSKPKPKRKPKTPKLILDAGSSNTKYYFDKEFDRFASKFKAFDNPENCPQGVNNVFTLGNKWYAIDDSTDGFATGKVEYGHENDNKIRSLPVWVVGALQHQDYFLRKLINKNKGNKKLIEFDLDLSLVTLSAYRLAEIKELIKVLDFGFNERKFRVHIKNIGCLPEGYGAAKLAYDLVKPSNKGKNRYRNRQLLEFLILDLGGGTITLTPYSCKGGVNAGKQQAMTGCGVQTIRKILATKAPGMQDRGSTCFFNDGLMDAIESSTLNEDGSYTCEYIDGRDVIPLGDALLASLHEWSTNLEPVSNILQQVSNSVNKGKRVFLTGGGFEISCIEKFVLDFIGTNAHLVETLPDPGQINVTGLK